MLLVRQFLTLANKSIDETDPQKKGLHCSGLVQIKVWQLLFIFSLQGLEISSFTDKGRSDHKRDYICTKQQSQPIPSCLKSWCLLLFVTNKCPLWYFFPSQNRALWSALKTCSVRKPFSSVIFLMASGNSSTASWSTSVAYPVILTFFKPNLFLKIIKPSFVGIKFSSFISFTFLLL